MLFVRDDSDQILEAYATGDARENVRRKPDGRIPGLSAYESGTSYHHHEPHSANKITICTAKKLSRGRLSRNRSKRCENL